MRLTAVIGVKTRIRIEAQHLDVSIIDTDSGGGWRKPLLAEKL